MLELYRNIKKLRIELGLSQNDLAKMTGYTDRSSIAKIEKGEVDLQQSKIVLFAKALCTTPKELMGWVDEDGEENFDKSNSDSYYLNADAREMAQFMFENPEYKVLFDASRNVKKEDIEFVKEMMDRMRKDDTDDTGC